MAVRYRCEKCDNDLPAARVERRVPGSKGMVRLLSPVVCERCGQEMVRETYSPPRREVR